MNSLTIPALDRAQGTVRLPGSKSISNRVLMLAALAQGSTEIHDLLDSDDTRVTLAALDQLGVGVTRLSAQSVRVTGCEGRFPVREASLFMGNAGTAIRPLTAVLALCGGLYRLHGVARMHERPIGDLVDGLQQLGADVRYEGNAGYPPLLISPAKITLPESIQVRGDVSSQFLTALLMALPLTGQRAVIEMSTELISKPYIEITLNLMKRFGVHVEREGWQRFVIPAHARYQSPGEMYVEGDASSASYFLAAGAIGGGPVRVEGVGRASIQGDIRFADALAQLGAQVSYGDNWVEASAPPSGRLKAFDLDLNHIPDAAMTLAVAALFADGPCRLRNIASWRVKETDRITAMATELRKLGATVEEGADYIAVSPALTYGESHSKAPVAIDTYDDHRMAMCFSLVALTGRPGTINDPACVNKTFPDYFNAFASLTAPVICIDGPSASGKGTIAERVAGQLGYHYLDSGSLYRLTALAATQASVALDDEVGVAALAAALPVRFERGVIWLGEDDVSLAIRTEAISVGASKVAALPAVRAALLQRQRDFRRFPGLVGDGRDMGSVVFPDAHVKIFLTASAQARADRRYKQLIGKGMTANMHALLHDLQERDARDSQRSVAPLAQCADAERVDTTNLGIDETMSAVMEIVKRHTNQGHQGKSSNL
jgi:3-phosphoshikimate 1-carboxyvinyltransferase